MSKDPWEQASPLAKRELRDEHAAILIDESGISEDVVTGRGYYSPTRLAIKKLVDLKVYPDNISRAKSWIAIPVIRPDGDKHCEILRLVGATGRMKYVWPTGYRNALDVHPDNQEKILSHSPLLYVEGIRKADAVYTAALRENIDVAVVAVNGCWGWHAKTEFGAIPVPDLQDIPMAKRWVGVVPDSDYRTNDNVRGGWSGLATYLSGKTGEAKAFLVIPPPNGFDKQGADDFLVNGGTLHDLIGLATTPRQALLDAPMEERRPMVLVSGLELIRRAADKVPHRIEPILPERSIVVMAGHSGTLKTWHALSLILDTAFGKMWLEHPEFKSDGQQIRCMYINREMGGALFESRLKIMARNPRYTDVADWENVLASNVWSPDQMGDFDLAKQETRDSLEDALQDNKISFVILDSLSMCWPSGDESSNSEVGQLYAQLRSITERTGVIWLIIHHTLKPTNTRKKDHLMFSVRGAGQIVQQADTAMLLTPNESPDPAKREVIVRFLKTRTDSEPPAFISGLLDNDGKFISLSFISMANEAKANAVVSSGGYLAKEKLKEWILTELPGMPAMSPGGPGIRTKQLVQLLRMAWPLASQQPPSEQAIQKAVLEMGVEGTLDLVEENKSSGNRYRSKDIIQDAITEDEQAAEASIADEKDVEAVEFTGDDESLAEEYLDLED